MPKQSHHEPAPVTSVQSSVVTRLRAARARIQPRMAAMARHLTDLVARASELPSHAPWDYSVHGFGALRTTTARDFSIDIDDPDKTERIAVDYYRQGPADLSALPTSSQAYAELMDSLSGSGLKVVGSTAGNISKIIVKPVVPVEFRVHADVLDATIRVFLRNVEDLGLVQYALKPEALDEKLMAAIDALLLHKPGDFHRLVGKPVSDPTSHR